MGKKRAAANKKVDAAKLHTLEEAMALVNQVNTTKFDASVDLHVRLGIDPRKADQALRGSVTLPHGTGKTKRVMVLCTPDKEEEAKAAGADYVGLDDLIQKVADGWTDVDVIVAMPQVMAKVGRIGRILGPRGLMPNPKTGTVTDDTAKAVKEVKAGRVDYKLDKNGNVSAAIGNVSFGDSELEENARAFVDSVVRAKPASAKGNYIQAVTLAATMLPGIPLEAATYTKTSA